MKKAVVLLSGGLDSATCLSIAKDEGFICYALSFAYGQRHQVELAAAQHIAKQWAVKEHRIVTLDIGQLGGSALTDARLAIPCDDQSDTNIPITYVPARNTIFLALSLAYAEVIGARDIYIGVSSVDYSGYPDCRLEFIKAFQTMANLATKAAIEGQSTTLHTPLLHLSKAQTILVGRKLGVDYAQTISCYQATEHGEACGICYSCSLRKKGFNEAGLADPTQYLS